MVDWKEAESANGFYPLTLTPTFFKHRTVLVIGGGKVAERRVKHLLAAGATIQLISPTLTPTLSELATAGKFEYLGRGWQPEDVANFPAALLVFAATNDLAVNQAVAEVARANGRLVNVADDPLNCDFTLPAVLRQGEINLTVSTGASPALTAHLRQKLAEIIGPEYSELARLMGKLRPNVKSSLPLELRPIFWTQLINSPILDLLRNGHDDEARALAENLLLEAQRVSE